MRPEILPVPCLQDNYCYLIADRDAGDAWLVDPSEPGPPAEALAREGLTLRGILATHHHHDHVGGVEALIADHPAIWVAAHASDRGRVPGQTIFIDAPRGRYVETTVSLGDMGLLAMHIPGHTTGAIAWCIPADADGPADVFTGDTLFAAGCGRLFEGTPAMMFESLRAMTDLEDDARLWFGHEYTAANLRFAAVAEPDNDAIRARSLGLRAVTTPSTVALERATNPFLRAGSVDELAARRAAKDQFTG